MRPQLIVNGIGNSLAPADIATIYNVVPFYREGLDGTGQRIVVIGCTDIDMADIQAFRRSYGLPPNDPQKVLVPGSEQPGIRPDDIEEADLDLEWAGAIAPNATVLYVYSYHVWQSVEFAIDNALAPVISFSYLACEPLVSPRLAQALRAMAQKASAQGITWVACSGDSGAAGCEAQGGDATEAATGLQVDVPASIPEVTAVGGTEFAEGSGRYWSDTPGPDKGSALSYIPEIAWNNTAVTPMGFAATGGGLSRLYPQPDWQRGPGVPNESRRAVPDIALAASAHHDPYVIVSGGRLEAYAGTSAATPAFAAMLVLVNQYLVSRGFQAAPGLGNINPMLYRLAEEIPDVFHDVTSGGNAVRCRPGSPDCATGLLGYDAGPGYDPVTGLGSVDALKLAAAWSAASSRPR